MHPKNSFFADFSENTALYTKIVPHENIWHLICDKKGYIHFCRKMTLSPKKWSCPQKIFFVNSSKNVAFFEKLLDEKIFKISFPIKKVIFIFAVKHPLPFKRDLAPRNGFSAILSKNSFLFFWKNRWIIKYSVPNLWYKKLC